MRISDNIVTLATTSGGERIEQALLVKALRQLRHGIKDMLQHCEAPDIERALAGACEIGSHMASQIGAELDRPIN